MGLKDLHLFETNEKTFNSSWTVQENGKSSSEMLLGAVGCLLGYVFDQTWKVLGILQYDLEASRRVLDHLGRIFEVPWACL